MSSYYGELGSDIVADPIEDRGYNELFDPPVQSEYECPICMMCLRDPVQTACGHRFCKSCIHQHMRTVSATCPYDRKPLGPSNIFDDNFAKREINNFTVKCRTVKNGKDCPWKGELLSLENHLATCECYDVLCTKGCGQTVERKALDNHVREECPKAQAHCEFKHFGCQWVGLRSDFAVHLENDLVSHVSLLLFVLCVLKTTSGNFKELSRKVAQNEEKANEMKANRKPTESQQQAIAELEARRGNGVFLWHITDYAGHLENACQGLATAVYSPAFYTAFYGYKFCLSLNPNGAETGRGSHVSLFVHMMQSTWDDILEWPICSRMSLSIQDQSDDGERKRHIIKLWTTRPNELAFQRPTTPRNPIGDGFVEFARLETLQERQYVKNNCLLVRVQVYN